MLRTICVAAAITALLSGSALAQKATYGRWTAECQVDRMTDKTRCITELALEQTSGRVGVFSLMIQPGPVVSIAGGHVIQFAQMRLGKNPALSCRGDINACRFSPQDSATIVRQMPYVEEVLASIATVSSGVFDFTEQAGGYRAVTQQLGIRY